MKNQGYYLYPDPSNIEIADKLICVNCTGIVAEEHGFISEMPCGRNDYYIQYLVSGNLKVYFENTTAMMKAGDMIVYYPHTHYKYEGYDDTEYYWVHFSGSEAKNILRKCGFKSRTIYTVGINQKVISDFERLFRNFIARDGFFELALEEGLMRLCLDMARAVNLTANGATDERINRIISTIHKNYNSNISISELAASEYMSEGYLRVLFTKRYGMSPKQYITSLRISTAKQMLEQSEISIAEAAKSVGISDPLYFSRIFKQYIGKSPSEYKKAPLGEAESL